MSVSWEALCEDIRRAQPPLSWELIREAHRYVEAAARRDSNSRGPDATSPCTRADANPRENPLWPLRARDDDQEQILDDDREDVPVMAKGPKGGSGAHGKAGAADKGKSDIDRTGKFGKHHGGNLSGNAKGGKAGGGKK